MNHTCRLVLRDQIASTRTHVVATHPKPVFEIEVEGHIYHLNMGRFVMIDDQTFVSSATGGVLAIKKGENSSVASYMATEFKRFSIAFSILLPGYCQLIFRIVTVAEGGVLLFREKTHLFSVNNRISYPNKNRLNTIALLGVKPGPTKLSVKFTVFDQSTGDTEHFTVEGPTAPLNIDEVRESHNQLNMLNY